MADSTFTAKLVDGISGPAKDAASSVDSLATKMNALSKTSKSAQLPSSFGDKLKSIVASSMSGSQVGSAGSSIEQMSKSSPALQNLTSRLSSLGIGFDQMGGMAVKAGGMLAAGFTAAITAAAAAAAAAAVGIVAAVGAIAGAIATASVAFTNYAIKVGKFRQNSMTTMSVLLKDVQKAKRVYADAVDFASSSPLGTQESIDMFKKLIAAGFDPAELKRVATALGDAAAASGDQMAMQSLTKAMSQIRAKGRLQGEELLQLTGSGAVGQKEIFANIADAMKVKPENVDKLLKAGKISSDVAIEATIKAIEQTRGGTMSKLAATLEGQLSMLRSRPFELFNAAFNEENGGLSKYFKSLTNIVKYLQEAFNPKGDTGKRIVAFIKQFASGLDAVATLVVKLVSGFVKGFDTKSLDEASDAMTSLADIDVEALGKSMESLGRGIGQVTGSLVRLNTLVVEGVKYLAQYETTWEIIKWVAIGVGALMLALGAAIVIVGLNIAGFIAFTVGIPLAIAAALAGLAVYVGAKLAEVGNYFLEQGPIWYEAGVNMVMGFVNGISSMIGLAVGKAKELAGGVAEAIRASLRISSPSKLMESYGSFTAQGFAGGLEGGTSEVSTSALAMSASAVQGAATGARATVGGSGGGITIQSLVVNASSGSADDIKNAVLEAFEQIALEMGGGVA